MSTTLIGAAVERHDLLASYVGTKPIFTPEALTAWVPSLPSEPWKITYH